MDTRQVMWLLSALRSFWTGISDSRSTHIESAGKEEIFRQRIRHFLSDVKEADKEYAFTFSAAYGYVKSGEEGIDKAFICADKKMYICKMQMKQERTEEEA